MKKLPITRIYSTASISKQYPRMMGFKPLLEKQPDFDRRILGLACATYFGGRSEVKVRKVNVPVMVCDYTSMYPTVFILQDLQRFSMAKHIEWRSVDKQTQEFLNEVTADALFDPAMWPKLCVIVKMRPAADLVPIRTRLDPEDPLGIVLAHYTSDHNSWYTLADLVAAKLLGGKVPEVLEAIEFVPHGVIEGLQPVKLRGALTLDPHEQIFKTVVEQRQLAKMAKRDGSSPESKWLDYSTKTFANSGAYGIYFEINVAPSPASKPVGGRVYSDIDFRCADIADERAGAFFDPFIATFVTSGARLMLALFEYEVRSAGGVFAFGDTDSFAVVAGDDCPASVPCLSPEKVRAIIRKFDRLNPYDPAIVPHLLKVEFSDVDGLRCFAVSAKRYVLFTQDQRGRIRIVKASESGLGAIIGRSKNETVPKLARRMWLKILHDELRPPLTQTQKRRLRKLFDLSGPLRHKLPITKPHTLSTRGFRHYNKGRPYSEQIKPFNFLQRVTPLVQHPGESVSPVAPYERDLKKSRRLEWFDFGSGGKVDLDWFNSGHAGAVPVMTLDDYVKGYARHPERKGADEHGQPAGPEVRGILGRLEIVGLSVKRIGKELDRDFEEEGVSLEPDEPIEYIPQDSKDVALKWALRILDQLPRRSTARSVGLSERRLLDILKHRSRPSKSRRRAIIELARAVAAEPTRKRRRLICESNLGKEIDRIVEEEDVALEDQEPIRYEEDGTDSELDEALEVIKQIPQADVAAMIGISERRLRDIEHHRVRPRESTRAAIVRLASELLEEGRTSS